MRPVVRQHAGATGGDAQPAAKRTALHHRRRALISRMKAPVVAADELAVLPGTQVCTSLHFGAKLPSRSQIVSFATFHGQTPSRNVSYHDCLQTTFSEHSGVVVSE
jgi:hypothetical protein